MNEDRREGSSESPEWRVPGDEQLETNAYHVWKPRPLLRSVHWKPLPPPSREAGLGSYDVFIDQRVLKAIHQHVWAATAGQEPLGFLVGDLCEDPDTGRRYVIVSAAVPSKFPLSEEDPEQIRGEALVAMQLEVDRLRGVLAGWYHRHATGPVELTAEDLQTHERHFPEPWQIALLFVTDHAEPAGGCFRRTRNGLAGDVPLPFFEMVSNESLLARGVRRSRMDWVNVETADAIDRDPPPRPEPDRELPAELEAEPESLVDAEPPTDVAEPDEIDFAVLPEATETDSADLPEPSGELAGDAGSSDEAGVPPILPLDSGPELSGEHEASGFELEETLAELDAAAAEFSLPVLDDLVETSAKPDEETDTDLPEPGWDDGGSADEVSLPLLEDVDLESFVTEVETADVAAQVDESVDIEEIEPQWDEAEIGDALKAPEAELALDVRDEDEDEVDDEDEEASTAAREVEPDAGPEERAAPPRETKPRRSWVVGGVLVALAIVVSILVFVLPSGPDAGDAGPSDTTPAPAVDAGEGLAEPPEVDMPAETDPSSVEGPVDSPPAADSLPAAASVQDMERLGDSLLESISRYYGLAVAEDGGQATCGDLRAGYVEVDDRWISYNVQGRANFRGRLPDELATRDERLYSGVQDVEREFTRSGCERP